MCRVHFLEEQPQFRAEGMALFDRRHVVLVRDIASRKVLVHFQARCLRMGGGRISGRIRQGPPLKYYVSSESSDWLARQTSCTNMPLPADRRAGWALGGLFLAGGRRRTIVRPNINIAHRLLRLPRLRAYMHVGQEGRGPGRSTTNLT